MSTIEKALHYLRTALEVEPCINTKPAGCGCCKRWMRFVQDTIALLEQAEPPPYEPTKSEIEGYVSACDGDVTYEQARDALIYFHNKQAEPDLSAKADSSAGSEPGDFIKQQLSAYKYLLENPRTFHRCNGKIRSFPSLCCSLHKGQHNPEDDFDAVEEIDRLKGENEKLKKAIKGLLPLAQCESAEHNAIITFAGELVYADEEEQAKPDLSARADSSAGGKPTDTANNLRCLSTQLPYWSLAGFDLDKTVYILLAGAKEIDRLTYELAEAKKLSIRAKAAEEIDRLTIAVEIANKHIAGLEGSNKAQAERIAQLEGERDACRAVIKELDKGR